jgi:hypothetical protein
VWKGTRCVATALDHGREGLKVDDPLSSGCPAASMATTPSEPQRTASELKMEVHGAGHIALGVERRGSPSASCSCMVRFSASAASVGPASVHSRRTARVPGVRRREGWQWRSHQYGEPWRPPYLPPNIRFRLLGFWRIGPSGTQVVRYQPITDRTSPSRIVKTNYLLPPRFRRVRSSPRRLVTRRAMAADGEQG